MSQQKEKSPRATVSAQAPRPTASLLTAHDLYLFNEGTHYRIYEKLGSHPLTVNGVAGTHFWPTADG